MTIKSKGHIVLVNMYDSRYWNVFLDEVFVDVIHKNDFTEYVFKSSVRKTLAKKAKVEESELIYTLIDLYEYEDVIPDFDSNGVETYQELMDICNQYNIPTFFDKVDLSYIEKKY